MKRLIMTAFISLLLTGCAATGTINWTDDGAYCFDSMDDFWKFDQAIEAFDLIAVQEVVDSPSTILLPQGTNVKIRKQATDAVSPAKIEVVAGEFDGVICYTYQGAVDE